MTGPRYELIDGEAMHRKYPASFKRVPAVRLERIEPGSFVKIGAKWRRRFGDEVTSAERFWVIVTEMGTPLRGLINNDLVYTAEHGLKCGDAIRFELRHVLNFMSAREMQEEIRHAG